MRLVDKAALHRDLRQRLIRRKEKELSSLDPAPHQPSVRGFPHRLAERAREVRHREIALECQLAQ